MDYADKKAENALWEVFMFKKLVRLSAVLLAGMLLWGSVDINVLQVWADSYGENVIINPNFADSDVSAWGAAQGKATITAVQGEDEIFEEVTTYGMISDRTSPYECIAQDITNLVENGKEYEYSFFAKLSWDYDGAPADQRELHFAPYVTINGATSYLGSYSEELKGTCTRTLVPGEWTYYKGTFKIDYSGNIDQIVIRLLEQGNNFGQGDCVLGDYYITGVSLREIQKDPIVLEDVVPVKDAVTQVMGDDFRVGAAVTVTEFADQGVEAIIKKHFNALTIGNELKPDALFGYSNAKCPGTTTAVLNGEELVVPKLDFSRAEKILNKIKKWNEANPDNQIKMRGHVLLWHSQTPEWFFHENYDASKDYVSVEVMNKRLEWYIKTVLEHFTGADSPYKGMFYGWDVVNEAVSDATGTYRTDKEKASESLSSPTHGSNSSWWHVYQSEEFIINAFRYANKYAPADVELYYNDYNEFETIKMNGILALLKAVKEAEGTRLDGMGMQAHYSTGYPDKSRIETALRKYAEAAGSVQLTEWDYTGSGTYDGTEATRMTEYVRIANRYKECYNIIQSLKKEGVNITGMTFWGTIDKYSWLQNRSNVGGGTDGTQKQCPMLFDDNYNVKPAYWAFVDQSLIETNGQAAEEPEETKQPETAEKPEESQTTEESKTVEESVATEESQTVEESQVTEESQTVEESQVAEESKTTEESQTADEAEDDFPWTIIIVAVSIVAAISVGIFVVTLVKETKNKEK